MKLIVAFIFSAVWLFGGGFVVRRIDELWRKRPQGSEPSRGFDPIISRLYYDATQRQDDRPYVEKEPQRRAPQ